MKKGLLILSALALMAASACQPVSQDNGNANSGNKNYSQGIAVDPRMVPVAINLTYKRDSDIYHFDVSPPTVTINGTTQQIQWIVSNTSDLDLTDVKIYNFKGEKTGNTDPFRNGGVFSYNTLSKRSVNTSQLSGSSSAYDTYEYEVVGTLTLDDGSKVTVKLDPKVVISGG